MDLALGSISMWSFPYYGHLDFLIMLSYNGWVYICFKIICQNTVVSLLKYLCFSVIEQLTELVEHSSVVR